MLDLFFFSTSQIEEAITKTGIENYLLKIENHTKDLMKLFIKDMSSALRINLETLVILLVHSKFKRRITHK